MTATPAAVTVDDESEFYTKLRELLKNKEKYKEASEACLSIFEKNKGALDLL